LGDKITTGTIEFPLIEFTPKVKNDIKKEKNGKPLNDIGVMNSKPVVFINLYIFNDGNFQPQIAFECLLK